MRAREFLGGRSNSLATRLFLSATAWVVVILLITGVVLSSVYRSASQMPSFRSGRVRRPSSPAIWISLPTPA